MKLIPLLINAIFSITVKRTVVTTNLVINPDAERNSTIPWSQIAPSKLIHNAYSTFNISRGITSESEYISLAKFCWGGATLTPGVTKISASQNIAIGFAQNSTDLDRRTFFNFTSHFIRYFLDKNTTYKDYATVSLKFVDQKNQPLVFNYKNSITLLNENKNVNQLSGALQPFRQGKGQTGYIFPQNSNGTVPFGARTAVVTIDFFLFGEDFANRDVAKAFVDKIYLALTYIESNEQALNPPFIKIITPQVLGVSAYVGIGIGGFGVLLLFLIVPFFVCFKKEQRPLYKRFSLKRRNTSIRRSFSRRRGVKRDSEVEIPSTNIQKKIFSDHQGYFLSIPGENLVDMPKMPPSCLKNSYGKHKIGGVRDVIHPPQKRLESVEEKRITIG